ncbi:MAG: permease-like cell division protein FtsX [Bacteroidales bacterium]|nr:permease-like cell division protein FtsX [Candidatus Cryptobacteroides equifaecalis]
MAKADNKMMRRRIVNAYLSSVISISLVLFLIGIASLLIVNARNVSDYFKETLQISVLMKNEATEQQASEYMAKVQTLPYVKEARVVSREEGTKELQDMLGEDFLSVFETSPVPVSVDVSLKAAYVSSDSLALVLPVLAASDLVDEVSCQQSLVDALNSNLGRISAVLSVFIALLLFISFVLINNTVRVNVFSRRFVIHTMRLVGATRSFISAPFIKAGILQGLVGSALSIAALAGLLFALRGSFPQLFEIFTLRTYVLTGVIVVFSGILICMISTWFVMNKLLDMKRNELYF